MLSLGSIGLVALPLLQTQTEPAPPARGRVEAVWVDPRALVLDGDVREWATASPAPVVLSEVRQLVSLGPPVEQLWSGPEDASLELFVGWNAQDLVLGGIVRDEWSDHDEAEWYRGDSLELFLDTRDREPQWGSDDYQIMLAPDWPERPWGVYSRPVHSALPGAGAGGFGGVEVAAMALEPGAGGSAAGYRFEVRIPWSNFGRAPTAGAELGFNFALCDRDGKAQQESYLTWTGEREIAVWGDRRGTLVLGPEATAAAEKRDEPLELPSAMPFILAGMYALAFFTRRVWRSSAARRRGLVVGALLLGGAGAVALLASLSAGQDTAERRAALERYWQSFRKLCISGALGHPEPDHLMREASALLAGEAIPAPPEELTQHLVPAGWRLGQELATGTRALPFRPFLPPEGASPTRGFVLAPGEECVLALPAAASVDAFHLITRISDRRFLDAPVAPVPALSVQFLAGEQTVLPTREVRHRQDLHLDEEEHEEHPGLELAADEPGGRLGRLHSDGLLLELGTQHEIDRVSVRHVGQGLGYPIELLAAAVITRQPRAVPPDGIRANAGGEWEWAGWREDVEAEVTPLGRGPRGDATAALRRSLAIGASTVASVYLTDHDPGPAGGRLAFAGRLGFLPLVVAAVLAPFLVTLLAEWLAARQRIRGKLAWGFAITSAVPLLALTLLLDASLEKEHEIGERERVADLLTRAEAELERAPRELELEAQRLLRIADLRARVDERFPATAAELASPNWWGEGEVGVIRVLDRVASDGSRTRLGSGPGWRELPASFRPRRSDLLRPWGQLFACGVAQASSGAAQPLSVLVARPARLSADAHSGGVRLIGAERDPAPHLEDVTPAAEGEVRRAVYNAERDLVAVLSLTPRERGVPVLGAYSLTELLVAAGLTALFTAALFAGILTGSIVRPIERLHRAVREGRPGTVQPGVQDEVGHLTGAIASFADELARRVEQLETLRRAQEELSSHLDWELACSGVLQFFRDQTGALHVWLFWTDAGGEGPRLFGLSGAERVPPAGKLFGQALEANAERVLGAHELEALSEPERALFAGAHHALLLPLSAGGERRGALALAFADERTNEDQTFLRAAAGQAAVVLENARLYMQASVDPVTGFLFDGGFKQRLSEEIARAAKGSVLLVEVRLRDLPADDARATARLREAARRMRAGVRGLAVFGRSGSADLRVAVPQPARTGADAAEALARGLVERLSRDAWPDGEMPAGIAVSSAAWPQDGPSGRLVLHLLDERLAEAHADTAGVVREASRADLPADFVAQSPLMLELLDMARRVAAEDLTVLVVGETGVGKDRVARLVHEWSPRRDGPLVHIHCPSLPANLIEDELFGHVAGAFTGAVQNRMGPFAYAAGGTVVLDEVGGLPPEGQVALLRLIETREVLPLGSTRPVPIDVRIVATSSADLAAEVEAGRFRGDLYFRLNVAQLTVPPLRLRRQDLPQLVEAQVERFNAQAARPVTGVAPEVLDVLCDHPWPGNLRQLENALSGALLLAAGEELRMEHLPVLDAAPPTQAAPPRLNPRQMACLESTPAGGWVSSAEYSRSHGISARTGLRDLLELVELGFLERHGARRATRFRRSRKALGAAAVGR